MRIAAVTVVEILVLVLAVIYLPRLSGDVPTTLPRFAAHVASVATENGPPYDQDSLQRAAADLRADITVFSEAGEQIVTTTTTTIPPPEEPGVRFRSDPDGPVLFAHLPDRSIVVAFRLRDRSVPPRPVILLATVALLTVSVGSLLLARSVVGPIERLATTASRVRDGDLEARAGINSRDEFGALGAAFDEMVEKLAWLLRSNTELLANVSHELRTPLARLRLGLELLEHRGQLGELVDAQQDVAELEQIVSDVLTAARLELAEARSGMGTLPLRLEPTTVGAIVGKIEARAAARHPDLPLAVRLPEDLECLELIVDPVLFRRAIDNIVDNALTHAAGAMPPTLAVSLDREALEWIIEDNGPGLAAEDLPRLGTPFFRSDRSRDRKTGGVGLGLALARRIIEAHAGSLDFENREGGGIRVSIRIPLAQNGIG